MGEFLKKFRANPKSPGIHYEKIHNVKDDKIRTVRDRPEVPAAVVLHPDKGEVYVLTWVDSHDEAMAWAADRIFEVNPVTGALQVVNITEVERAVTPRSEEKPQVWACLVPSPMTCCCRSRCQRCCCRRFELRGRRTTSRCCASTCPPKPQKPYFGWPRACRRRKSGQRWDRRPGR